MLMASDGTTGGSPERKIDKFEDVHLHEPSQPCKCTTHDVDNSDGIILSKETLTNEFFTNQRKMSQDLLERFERLLDDFATVRSEVAAVQTSLVAIQQNTSGEVSGSMSREELEEKISWIEKLYMNTSFIAEPLTGKLACLEESVASLKEEVDFIDERISIVEDSDKRTSLEEAYDILGVQRKGAPSDCASSSQAQSQQEKPEKNEAFHAQGDGVAVYAHFDLSTEEPSSDRPVDDGGSLAGVSVNDRRVQRPAPHLPTSDVQDCGRKMPRASLVLLHELRQIAEQDDEQGSDILSATSSTATLMASMPCRSSQGNKGHHYHHRPRHHHRDVSRHMDSNQACDELQGGSHSSHRVHGQDCDQEHRHHQHHHHHNHHHHSHGQDHVDHGGQQHRVRSEAGSLPRASLCMAQWSNLSKSTQPDQSEFQERRFSVEAIYDGLGSAREREALQALRHAHSNCLREADMASFLASDISASSRDSDASSSLGDSSYLSSSDPTDASSKEERTPRALSEQESSLAGSSHRSAVGPDSGPEVSAASSNRFIARSTWRRSSGRP